MPNLVIPCLMSMDNEIFKVFILQAYVNFVTSGDRLIFPKCCYLKEFGKSILDKAT